MAVIDKDKIIETIQAVTSDVESYVDDFLPKNSSMVSDCMRQKEAYIEIAQFLVVLRRLGRTPAKPNLQLMSRKGAIA